MDQVSCRCSSAVWVLHTCSSCWLRDMTSHSISTVSMVACVLHPPHLISEPICRMSRPGFAALRIFTRGLPSGPGGSFSVSSTWITASAPGGTGAPAHGALIRRWPGF